MFPPQPSEDLERWVENLWESLRRAGGNWADEAKTERTDFGTKVFLRLREPLSPSCKSNVKAYVVSYARASGWKARLFQFRPSYVAFLASRA
jgi:hypothetical protein